MSISLASEAGIIQEGPTYLFILLKGFRAANRPFMKDTGLQALYKKHPIQSNITLVYNIFYC